MHTPHPMPRQGQLHLRAPSSHTLPFLAWNIGGVCFCTPTLPADRGDLHSFAAIGYHFIGASRTHAAVSCSEHRGRMLLHPYPTDRQGRPPFIRRHWKTFQGPMTRRRRHWKPFRGPMTQRRCRRKTFRGPITRRRRRWKTFWGPLMQRHYRRTFQRERLGLRRPEKMFQRGVFLLRRPQWTLQRGVFLLGRPQWTLQRGVFLLRHSKWTLQRGVFLLRHPKWTLQRGVFLLRHPRRKIFDHRWTSIRLQNILLFELQRVHGVDRSGPPALPRDGGH